MSCRAEFVRMGWIRQRSVYSGAVSVVPYSLAAARCNALVRALADQYILETAGLGSGDSSASSGADGDAMEQEEAGRSAQPSASSPRRRSKSASPRRNKRRRHKELDGHIDRHMQGHAGALARAAAAAARIVTGTRPGAVFGRTAQAAAREQARRMGFVLKRRQSPYRSRRGTAGASLRAEPAPSVSALQRMPSHGDSTGAASPEHPLLPTPVRIARSRSFDGGRGGSPRQHRSVKNAPPLELLEPQVPEQFAGPSIALLGCRLAVMWAGNNWYTGTCMFVESPEPDGRIYVKYDDGDERFYRPRDKTFVVLATPPPAQSGDCAGDEGSVLTASAYPSHRLRKSLLSTLPSAALDMLAAGAVGA